VTELIIALSAVATLFLSIILYFYLQGGLDPGPLATWISGLASTSAVMVALWGQHRSQSQRDNDEEEKRSLDAHQINIKLYQIVKQSIFIHKTLRTSNKIIEFKTEEKEYKIFSRSGLGGFDDWLRPTLTASEEALFARLGKFDDLNKLKGIIEGVRIIQAAVTDMNKSLAELSTLSKNTYRNDDGKLRAEYDTSNINVRRLLLVVSSKLESLNMISALHLSNVLERVPLAHEVALSYLKKEEAFAIDLTDARAECALPMPRLKEDNNAADVNGAKDPDPGVVRADKIPE